MYGELDEIAPAIPYVALVAAGWIVRSTVVPARYQGALALVMVIATVGAGVGIARAIGVDLEGGRCRAATVDGDRCRLSRDPGDDLCHVHQRTHGVELHSEGVAEKRDSLR